MKCLLIFLGISLTASEKLDRTYLPPPGAQFAGGSPDDILTPLEPPKEQTGAPLAGSTPNGFQGFNNKEPLSKLPVTMTSYAFSQTTTYPSVESYEMNAVPINPFIGLPVQNLDQNNNLQYNKKLPDYSQQDNTFGITGQSGPLSQNQNIGTVGEVVIPTSNVQQPISNPEFQRYLSEQLNKDKFAQNSGLNVIQSQPVMTQENINPQDQYKDFRTQQVSNVHVLQDNTRQQPGENTLLSPNNQQQQFLPEIRNMLSPEPLKEKELRQSEQNHNDDFSTTPSYSSSASAYSSSSPIEDFERPQADRDKSAIILNYENVLKPNSYSYSYDTSNGIHADEIGLVGDGTIAKGSYSYIGYDGKNYSIFYTADENGFQPRGDHLPTPPPIPEYIKKIIEQAAKDKEAGIMDDGSYDENKYGYKNYHNSINHRLLQGNGLKNVKIRPVSGITSNAYDQKKTQNHYIKNVEIDDENKLHNNDFENDNQDDSEINTILENENNDFAGINDNESINDSSRTQDTSGLVSSIDEIIVPVSDEYNSQSNIINIKAPYRTGTGNKEGIEASQVQDFVNQELARPGQVSASLNDGYSEISNIRAGVIQRPVNNELSRIVNNKYVKGNIPQTGLGFVEKNGNNQKTIQKVSKNGYDYNPPRNQFNHTEFSPRFNDEKASSTSAPIYTTSSEITTSGSITPEVRIKPTDRQQYINRQSTTPRPFMTSRVKISRGGSYSDYDNDEDEDIDNESVTSTKQFSEVTNNDVRRPFGPSQTVTPSYMTSTMVTTPAYSSRFGNSETPQINSNSQPPNNFGNTKSSNYMYQSKRPSVDADTTSTLNYPSDIELGFGVRIPSKVKGNSERVYSTSTFRPTTTMQTTTGYRLNNNYLRPSQPSSTNNNGYQYQSVRSDYNMNPQNPESLDYVSNVDYYQTNNDQTPIYYSETTHTVSNSGLGNPISAPVTEYDHTSSEYGSKIMSLPPPQGSITSPRFPESQVPQISSSGYLYEPPKLVFPTTSSFSTFETSPDFTVPSTQSSHLSQVFSTQRPYNSPAPDTYDQNAVVDGFGRPIISESQSVFITPDQKVDYEEGLRRPVEPSGGSSSFPGDKGGSNLRPTYDVDNSPEYNNPAKIIGENFSGPQQPPKYDPQTGYHYK